MASWQIGEVVAHGGEVPRQVSGGGVPLLRVLGKATLYDPDKRSVCVSLKHPGSKALRLIAKDCGRGLSVALFPESGYPGNHFVEYRTERKLVGTKINLAPGRLFW